MKNNLIRIYATIGFLVISIGTLSAMTRKGYASERDLASRPRLIVTTDIGQDPDDAQSMIRLLHYANEFRIEGIIANADNNHKGEPPIIREDIVHGMIDAYAKIQVNLNRVLPGFPEPHELHRIVKRGCAGNGVSVPLDDFVGEGKDTEGSDWIIDVVDRKEAEPVCIAVWGGACDLAQALWHVKTRRSPRELENFISKLRVFFIGKQDSSNDWILSDFPKLWVILALHPSGDKWQSSYRGMFWGGDMSNTSKSWFQQQVVGQNPLASLYPLETFTGGENKNPYGAMKEGDSPSFLFFLPTGFNRPEHPEWGSWGGRYEHFRDSFFGDAEDTVFDGSIGGTVTSPRASVFRWRDDFQKDFSSRCQWAGGNVSELPGQTWCEVGGIRFDGVYEIEANENESVLITIRNDADEKAAVDNEVIYYQEAGNYCGNPQINEIHGGQFEILIPSDAGSSTLHFIVRSNFGKAQGNLVYHRLIVSVKP